MKNLLGDARFIAVLIVTLFSASGSHAQTSSAALEKALSAPAPVLALKGSHDWPLLQAFYAKRGFQPAWTGDGAAHLQAEQVLAVLAMAGDQGLDPEDYHIGSASFKDSQDALTYELLVSDGLLRYMQDVARGRVLPQLDDSDRALPLQPFDPVSVLWDALTQNRLEEMLAQLPPPFAGYRRLAASLAYYQAIEDRGGWPLVPSTNDEVDLDGEDPRQAVLWQRLASESPDIINKSKTPDMDRLKEAVRRYQARNGLIVDGRVGPKTIAALNMSVSERMRQIIANMERWRWLPRKLETRYIFVQLPDGILRYVADGAVKLDSRVIFGRPRDPSPVLRTQVVAVTANPPWTVPRSIAVNEILPLLRKEPDYLIRHHMVLLNGPPGDPYGMTIDWPSLPAIAFKYRVQQLPGSDNALGLIKLEMPNHYTVYLHDTPTRSLFSQPYRALSHGCIRVEEIMPLASLVLSQDRDAAQPMLKDAIATGETRRFNLSAPLPVYILYWTAIADDNGAVGFRPDIYKRDKRLLDEIARRKTVRQKNKE